MTFITHHLRHSEPVEVSRVADGVPRCAGDEPQHLPHFFRGVNHKFNVSRHWDELMHQSEVSVGRHWNILANGNSPAHRAAHAQIMKAARDTRATLLRLVRTRRIRHRKGCPPDWHHVPSWTLHISTYCHSVTSLQKAITIFFLTAEIFCQPGAC